jgi:flagellar protein FlaI
MSLILETICKGPVPKSETELKELITKLLNSSVDVGAGGDIEEDKKGPGNTKACYP